MAIRKEIGRQSVLSAVYEFTYADLTNAVGTNVAHPFFDIPPNSIIVGGELIVVAAWVGPTAATVDIGDAALATRYNTDVSLLATGRTALGLTGFKYTAYDAIQLALTQTVAVATAGSAILRIEYVSVGRVSENV